MCRPPLDYDVGTAGSCDEDITTLVSNGVDFSLCIRGDAVDIIVYPHPHLAVGIRRLRIYDIHA
jgi:hypothetical protein